ncbi:kinase-like domain-containing protein [Mycena rebaudengoi]|nr:kinase-like domain-containing protein [Mycena rebaudengoi]
MAEDIEPLDPMLCINLDSPGESCGGLFEHKTSPGLCAMCYMDKKDSGRAQEMKNWPQCTGCSAQLKNLRGDRCGTCLKKDQQIAAATQHPPDANKQPEKDPTTRSLQELQAEHRRNAMQARTLQKAAFKQTAGSGSLQSTLGHFFDTHDRVHGNHPKKILQGPSTLRLPSPAIYLEGLISVKDFEHATGASAPYFVHTEKENRKRRASQTTGRAVSLAASSTSKRIRTEVAVPLPLRSEFADLPGFSKVPFAFASVSIAEDGMVNIKWPDLSDLDKINTSICVLQDTPFDQGQTKLVHKIIVDGLPGVAKRFFNIGEGEGQVSIQENHDQVVQEVTRLSKAGYFLKRFFADAKRRGVDIEQGIQITDFKLGIEVVQDDSGPSKASGFSLEQYQATLEEKGDRGSISGLVIWLCEPRRSSLVKHWSGTNEYPPWHQNKLGSTLNAFAHYAYLFSQESTVLADLQTATVINEDGEGIQVLFDVMTHTLDGASGVGDHGKSGIDAFLAKHECVTRCTHLRLSRDGFTSEPASGSGDSDSD